jgi:hypothetical protein
VVEGRPYRDDIDAEVVHLHGFRVTDPSGEEQAAREAEYEQARPPSRAPVRLNAISAPACRASSEAKQFRPARLMVDIAASSSA